MFLKYGAIGRRGWRGRERAKIEEGNILGFYAREKSLPQAFISHPKAT